jgi:DNA-directed RNA polymerase subunit beta'
MGIMAQRLRKMDRLIALEQTGSPRDFARKIQLSERQVRVYLHCLRENGAQISSGSAVANTPREATGISDITGGLPRVTEIFEARKPKDPAVLAEIDGVVEIMGEKRRGKRNIVVRSESGIEREHLVPPGKRFLVHAGEFVKAGSSLVDGPLVPHDILRVSGEEAVQQYLLHEIQNVYRSQRVEINDKHIEIIVARMLRKVKVETPGDTSLLPGLICDRFAFREVNEELSRSLKITQKGDSDFEEGQIVPKSQLEQVNTQIEALGGTPAKGTRCKPANCSTQLLGITKAAVQSGSFISAASFQETTKVLTEAALAGKIDRLVGLKENVILGHLIPAGTGFRTFQDAEVHFKLEAMPALGSANRALEESFPLLESATPSESLASAGSSGGLPPRDLASMLGDPVAAGGSGLAAEGGSPAGPATADDLTLIEGIGPKTSELLNQHGISSFNELANSRPDQIRDILTAAGGLYARQDPTTWAQQAAMAEAGQWDELKAWQDELQGGVMMGAVAAGPKDDLTRIEGVGPKIEEHLNNAGIHTYQELANASPDQIRTILDNAGGLAAHDPTTWPQQAVMAAQGQWHELQAWQDQLDGGRVVEAAQPDDLTKVEGIGPAIQSHLNAAGIMTFEQLSNTSVDDIRGLLAAAGPAFASHDPTTWPQQAAMAAQGRWEELQAWQDELDGGRL